jgi:hypothetical protein
MSVHNLASAKVTHKPHHFHGNSCRRTHATIPSGRSLCFRFSKVVQSERKPAVTSHRVPRGAAGLLTSKHCVIPGITIAYVIRERNRT